MERVFLGWDRPGLEAAVEHIVERFGSPRDATRKLDLSTVIVAVPGARAGRRLLELLVERAEQEGRDLIAPEIRTIGELPERLYL
ncbi:MAG TPA: hypothetical protein VK116_04315, partial [Planctomycetota bacterium]|nr:hypothetical protein [Planctomycetota bacterium]